MDCKDTLSRRRLLGRWLLGASLAPLVLMRPQAGRTAELPLLSPVDPAAKKVQYVDDATKAKGAPAGNTCATCALYQGTYASVQGPCQIFPGKQVKAAGWCASWAPQM
ncbi:MAG TPA: high-potential iron-sulfur protein [Steroidobacteraceae bacterium]